MLKLGIVGLGQAGGNIADYAITQNFNAIAINTAMVDLNMLKYIPDENKLCLKGYNGAGRNRDIGKSSVVEHAEQIYEFVKTKLYDCDIVFIAGSTSGGTGSGALPVVTDILLELFEIVNIICVLPDDLESPSCKMNSYDCLAEIIDNQQLGSIFIIDNDRGRELLRKPKYVVHKVLNEDIIDLIGTINSFTNKTSYTNNFDDRDLIDILSTRGCTMITHTKIKSNNIDDNDLSAMIRESFKKSYSPEYNQENIIKCAILGNIPKQMSSKFNLSQIFNDNIPYDIRDCLYDLDKQQNIEFYNIYAGMQLPEKKIQKMKLDIEKVQDTIVEKFETSQNQKMETVDWKINNIKFDRTFNKDSQISLSEKLKKFK